MADFDIKNVKVGDLLVPISEGALVSYGQVTKRTDDAFFVQWDGEMDFLSEYPFKLPDWESGKDRYKANWATMLKHSKIVQNENEILAFLIKLN